MLRLWHPPPIFAERQQTWLLPCFLRETASSLFWQKWHTVRKIHMEKRDNNKLGGRSFFKKKFWYVLPQRHRSCLFYSPRDSPIPVWTLQRQTGPQPKSKYRMLAVQKPDVRLQCWMKNVKNIKMHILKPNCWICQDELRRVLTAVNV